MCTVITVLGVLVKVTMVPIVAFCGGYGPPVLVLLCDYPSLKVHGKLSRLLSSSLSSSSLWKKGLCFLVKSTQRERCGLCLQCWRWSCFLTATLPIYQPPRPIDHLRAGGGGLVTPHVLTAGVNMKFSAKFEDILKSSSFKRMWSSNFLM